MAVIAVKEYHRFLENLAELSFRPARTTDRRARKPHSENARRLAAGLPAIPDGAKRPAASRQDQPVGHSVGRLGSAERKAASWQDARVTVGGAIPR